MSDSDKMRAEFEALCDSKNYSTEKDAFGNYWLPEIDDFWVMFQLGYAAGQKAEREAMQRESEEWSKAVNKRWIETRTLRGEQ